MVSVLLANVFYAKIINTQGEQDGASFMGPETRRKGALAVALRIETLHEWFLGKEACLWKLVHSARDFDIDVAVDVYLSNKTVVFNKVRREVAELESHVFIAQHRSVEVEILDVNCHELSIQFGDDTC